MFWGCCGVGCYKLAKILKYKPLISAPFMEKTIKINNKQFGISLSVGPVQKKYRELYKISIRDSDIMIFVYDITNEESFNELKDYYIPRAFEILGNNFKGVKVANNSDLYMYEMIPEEAKHLADSYGFKFILHLKNIMVITLEN